MMIFVTNSSFIYMEYFGVGPARFSVLFALSVLGFMSMNLFSMWRLEERQRGNVLPRRADDSGGRRRRAADGGRDGPCRARRRSCRSSCSPCRRSASSVRRARRATWASFGELAGSASSVYTTHDVPARRYVRLAERRAQRRHAAADRGDDARRVVDGERDQLGLAAAARGRRALTGAPDGGEVATSARTGRRRRRCCRGRRRGADSRASSRCARRRRIACSSRRRDSARASTG